MGFYDFNAPNTFTTEADAFFMLGRLPFGSSTEDMDFGAKAKVVDGTGMGADWTNKRASTRDATWKLKGHYAGGKGQVSWALNWLFGRTTAIPMFGTLSGLDLGAPVHAMPGTITDNSSKGSMSDSGKFDGEVTGLGASDMGYVLASPYTTNVLTTTGLSSADDASIQLPSGSQGGALYIAFIDFQGGTTPSIALKASHCATLAGTYVDLTETAFTVLQSDTSTWLKYLPISSTTLINPFVKLNWTTTGAPTGVQPLVVFARRPQRGKAYTGSN